MRGWRTLMIAGAALAVIGACCSVATALPTAASTVRIELSGGPQGGNPESGVGRFVMSGKGQAVRGTVTYAVHFGSSGTNPSGQHFARMKGYLTLTTTSGELTITTAGLTFGLSGEDVHSGRDVWTGTWKIADGSGAFASFHGGGGYVGTAGPNVKVLMRLEGSTT